MYHKNTHTHPDHCAGDKIVIFKGGAKDSSHGLSSLVECSPVVISLMGSVSFQLKPLTRWLSTHEIEQGRDDRLVWWGHACYFCHLTLIISPMDRLSSCTYRLRTTNARHPLSGTPQAARHIVGMNGIHRVVTRAPSVKE